MKKMWEFRQSTAPKTLELYIYGDVEGDGYDWWWGETIESETSANHFREELANHPEAQEINIYINSYGGSVFEGTAIYNQLKRHPAHKTVHVDGFACSIAATIAMAGDTVVMPKNAMMMIHNAWMTASGDAGELRKAADDLDQINKGNRQAYLAKSNGKLTEEQLVEMLNAETWLTAEDCVAYGFADEYAEQNADLTKATALLQKVNLNLQQHINVQTSLAAQLRQIKQEYTAPEPPVEEPEDIPPEPNPEEQPKQKTFFNFKEEQPE